MQAGILFVSKLHDSVNAEVSTLFAPHLAEVNAETSLNQIVDQEATPRFFEIRLDIGWTSEMNHRIAETVFLVLTGAGFRQEAQHIWTSTGCDMEEAADTLSDVFLELQQLDVDVKNGIRHMSVTMCEAMLDNN